MSRRKDQDEDCDVPVFYVNATALESRTSTLRDSCESHIFLMRDSKDSNGLHVSEELERPSGAKGGDGSQSIADGRCYAGLPQVLFARERAQLLVPPTRLFLFLMLMTLPLVLILEPSRVSWLAALCPSVLSLWRVARGRLPALMGNDRLARPRAACWCLPRLPAHHKIES